MINIKNHKPQKCFLQNKYLFAHSSSLFPLRFLFLFILFFVKVSSFNALRSLLYTKTSRGADRDSCPSSGSLSHDYTIFFSKYNLNAVINIQQVLLPNHAYVLFSHLSKAAHFLTAHTDPVILFTERIISPFSIIPLIFISPLCACCPIDSVIDRISPNDRL